MTEQSPPAPPSREPAYALSKLEPGRLPFDVFLQVARLTVTPVIEVVPVRKTGTGTSVLLTKRPDSDPVWGGLWHTPGTVIRSYDSSIDDGLRRLIHDELNDCVIGEPRYVGHVLHKVLRGTELALIHWVEAAQEPTAGTFFDADHLPDTLVDSQREFIKDAVGSYLRVQSNQLTSE